jgi:FtsZ-binding cell division protein ZapB
VETMDMEDEISQIKNTCSLRYTSIMLMQKDIEEIKENDKKHEKKLDFIVDQLSCMNDKLDKRYAGKWVERFVTAVVILFALAALNYVFKHVGLPY